MKKFVIAAILAVVSLSASAQVHAWERRVFEGSMILAQRNLSEDGKTFVDRFLGKSFYEDVQYLYQLEKKKQAKHSTDIHFLYLDKDLRPMQLEGESLISTIEKNMAIVKDREGRERKEVVNALRTIINLMCDMHLIGHVRLESIPHSMQDFKFLCYSGDTPKYNKRKHPVTWSRFWSIYDAWHNGVTGAMWANDYEYAYGDKAKQYSAGSLYDWAADCGKVAGEIYQFVKPEYEMPRIQRNDLKELHFEMMAKLGYRLSVLLDQLAQ